MYARFQNTSKGTNAYIQKSVRVDGRSKTITVKCLGLLSEIQKKYGCADPRQWVEDLVARMTLEEKESRKKVVIELSPSTPIKEDSHPLRHGGDLMLLRVYNRLGLPAICNAIATGTRVKYDLNEILQTLVTSRILFPCSKSKTIELAQSYVKPPKFTESDIVTALSLLANNIDMIRAELNRHSCSTILSDDLEDLFPTPPTDHKAYVLVDFIAKEILKRLHRELIHANADYYKEKTLAIDSLLATLRDLRFAFFEGHGYVPMFTRTDLTDQLQTLVGVNISTQIIPTRTMTAYYRRAKS